MPHQSPVFKVFFNASVILAGINSPGGGSAKLLQYIRSKKIKGLINVPVLDEAIKHADKIKKTSKDIMKAIYDIGFELLPAPKNEEIEKYYENISDFGDAHLLASSINSKCEFLVSLDKKHVLAIKNKINKTKIVSPKELLLEYKEKIGI